MNKSYIGVSNTELVDIIFKRAKTLHSMNADQLHHCPRNITGFLKDLEMAVKEIRKRTDRNIK